MTHPSLRSPTEEIADFFARGPSPEDIAAFRLSEGTRARVRELLAKNADGTLTPEENQELDQLVLLDRIVMLIRSRLPRPNAQAAAPRDGG
jgi:hypothetical protein